MNVVMGPDNTQDMDRLFEELVAQHQGRLSKMCFLYLRDAALAEDAVQETFLKAYRQLPRFRGDSSMKTWLTTIAMNTCHDLWRSSWLRRVDHRISLDQLPEASVPFTEQDDELVALTMKLPRKLREVILLYYYQEMNTTEIADLLGISQSSVSGRLKRARDKLRVLLEGSEFINE